MNTPLRKIATLGFISLNFLFLGACQTTPPADVYNPAFESFQVRKMTSKGIETVQVNFKNTQLWPDASFLPAEPYQFNTKKLKIGVIGDTGCRLKESNGQGVYQNCANPKEWPYKDLIETFAKESFDFAIHTGDYHYREQCSNPAVCAGYTKSIGYTWAVWWDDFFYPTQPLFKKSPLLLVRGNHEDCQRAFTGWNILSPLNKQFKEACVQVEPYQWIDLGDIVFINFDDSGFEDKKKGTEEETREYINVLKQIASRIDETKGKKEIWFLAHKPVYGYTPDKKPTLGVQPISKNLLQAMDAAGLTQKIDYILSGHVHTQQMVLESQNLMQVIVGH